MQRRAFMQTSLAAGIVGLGTTTLPFNRGHTPPRHRGDVVKLSSNENPLGLAPVARRAVIDGIPDANRYPGDKREEFTEALAQKHGVTPANIVLGAGSTEILQMAVQAGAGPHTRLIVAAPTFEDVPTYSMPETFELLSVPLDARYGHDLTRMREVAEETENPALVYICNPNHPTGTITACADLDAWISDARQNVNFLIDEAYFEYADHAAYWSSVKWINERPNVLVVRTFSKIYGMAGMRLGYGLAHEATIENLDRFKSSNSANYLALVAAQASLQDSGLIERSIEANTAGRQILYDCLDELDIEYLPSHTNFVMHRITGDLDVYIERMLEQNIKVGRPFPPMLDYNRVSIGLPEEMEWLAETLREFRKRSWI